MFVRDAMLLHSDAVGRTVRWGWQTFALGGGGGGGHGSPKSGGGGRARKRSHVTGTIISIGAKGARRKGLSTMV